MTLINKSIFATARKPDSHFSGACPPFVHRLIADNLTIDNGHMVSSYDINISDGSIGIFILTTNNKWSFVLLVCGLLFMVVMFLLLQYNRFRNIFKALRNNWVNSKKLKIDKNIYEVTQVKMHESKSFDAWWDTLCNMGKEMRFQNIELWIRQDSHFIKKCTWNRPEGKSIVGINPGAGSRWK